MGFNTTVFFLNDFWGDIRKDPEGTVNFILHAMNGGERENRHGVTVMKSEHADNLRMYVTWQNQIMEVSLDDEIVHKHLERPGGSAYLKAVVDRCRARLNALDALLVDRE